MPTMHPFCRKDTFSWSWKIRTPMQRFSITWFWHHFYVFVLLVNIALPCMWIYSSVVKNCIHLLIVYLSTNLVISYGVQRLESVIMYTEDILQKLWVYIVLQYVCFTWEIENIKFYNKLLQGSIFCNREQF